MSGGEVQERYDVLPRTVPGGRDAPELLAPGAGCEGLELRGSLLRVGRRGVDRLECGGQWLSVLGAGAARAGANQVHDAGLHGRLRIDRADRLAQALEHVDRGDQDIGGAAHLELVGHHEPELGALVLLDPQLQDVAAAVGGDPWRHKVHGDPTGSYATPSAAANELFMTD